MDGGSPFPDEKCAPYPACKDDALDSKEAPMAEQLVQIAGALLVLAGFTLAQFGRLDQRSATYLVLNLLGSATLAIDAMLGRQLGFLLLEAVWALVSAWGLVRLLSPRARQARLE